MDTQGDCVVCTGKGVVDNGVCRNCGHTEDGSLPKESAEESLGELPLGSEILPEAPTE